MESQQYFIIWNHGFKYLHEIMTIIRNHPSIQITRVFRRTINLDPFIKHIYKLDQSSYQHINEKSKYLKSIKPEIFIIFIRDINTIYKTKPNTNHKYSYNETFVKWHIRLLFNPRTKNETIDINNNLIDDVSIQRNWPNFITHNHIIHSSDIEEETKLVIDYFNLNKEFFDIIGHNYLISKDNIKDININDLVVNTTYKDHLNVKETPHYKYLLGNYKKEYDDYIMKHFGTVITYDNLSGAYDKLIEKFDYGCIINGKPSFIVCEYNKNINKYVVLDGVHRLSILINKGIDTIKVYTIS